MSEEVIDELVYGDKLLVMSEAKLVLYDITSKDHLNQDETYQTFGQTEVGKCFVSELRLAKDFA
ncbi:hypothetical protein J6590_072808 [Homalodisca vitripennis]|nr:hypothetical protein J6590_072808 [Homalodisca vitripennis]